jgi:hypothetical protein
MTNVKMFKTKTVSSHLFRHLNIGYLDILSNFEFRHSSLMGFGFRASHPPPPSQGPLVDQ